MKVFTASIVVYVNIANRNMQRYLIDENTKPGTNVIY